MTLSMNFYKVVRQEKSSLLFLTWKPKGRHLNWPLFFLLLNCFLFGMFYFSHDFALFIHLFHFENSQNCK